MADEDYEWLSPEAAERLLDGEQLGDVDDHVREQSKRLTEVLAALLSEAAPGPGAHGAATAGTQALPGARELPGTHELPGEQAALNAFRQARPAAANAVPAASSAFDAPASPSATANETDAAVQLGRVPGRDRPAGRPSPRNGGPARTRTPAAGGARRWARSLRWSVAAALTACTVGSVAVAAGAGVLPSPFEDRRHPGPGSSEAPEPGATTTAPTGPKSPSSTPPSSGRPSGSPRAGEETRGPGADHGAPDPTRTAPDDGSSGKDRDWRKKAVDACKDFRSGKLDDRQRELLKSVGRDRVEQYCAELLDGNGGGELPDLPDEQGGGERTENPDDSGRGGDEDGRASGGSGDRDRGDDEDGGSRRADGLTRSALAPEEPLTEPAEQLESTAQPAARAAR